MVEDKSLGFKAKEFRSLYVDAHEGKVDARSQTMLNSLQTLTEAVNVLQVELTRLGRAIEDINNDTAQIEVKVSVAESAIGTIEEVELDNWGMHKPKFKTGL